MSLGMNSPSFHGFGNVSRVQEAAGRKLPSLVGHGGLKDLEELVEVEILCMGGWNGWQTDRRSSGNNSGWTAVGNGVRNGPESSGLQSGRNWVNG